MTAAWFTARQIAEMGLPGLPAAKSPMIRRATREGWPSRERTGRGGGREYPVTALPAEARAELLRRAADAAPAVPEAAAALPVPVPVPATAAMADWQRRTMDARAAILAEVDRLAKVGTLRAAILEVVARAETINCGCTSLPFMAHWPKSTPGGRRFTAEEVSGNRTKRALAEMRGEI